MAISAIFHFVFIPFTPFDKNVKIGKQAQDSACAPAVFFTEGEVIR